MPVQQHSIKEPTKGKLFESVIFDVCTKIFPGAKISRNERIQGRKSKVLREVDIAVRQQIGPQEMLIVIDCKDHNRQIDVITMHAFCGLKDDVGAHAGVVVSREGFTKAALEIAKESLVTAYQYANDQTAKWPDWIWIGVVVDIWMLTPTKLSLTHADGTEEYAASDTEMTVIDKKTNQDTGIATILRKFWESEANKREGSLCYSFPAGPTPKQEDQKINIGFLAEHTYVLRRGKLTFAGLADPVKKATISTAYTITVEETPLEIPSKKESDAVPNNSLGIVVGSTIVKTADRIGESAAYHLTQGFAKFELEMGDTIPWPLPSNPFPGRSSEPKSDKADF